MPDPCLCHPATPAVPCPKCGKPSRYVRTVRDKADRPVAQFVCDKCEIGFTKGRAG